MPRRWPSRRLPAGCSPTLRANGTGRRASFPVLVRRSCRTTSAAGRCSSRPSFMPGGRTNWHKHAVGQILYVLSGVGRYQLEGEPVQEIKPGDTVVIPPNARHWHGSAPDTMMVHLAMSETNDKGEATSWFDPVREADHPKAPAKA